MRDRFLRLLVGAVLCTAAGCGRPPSADILTLVDFNPPQVEFGDRCEILGQGFPVGAEAVVTLEGQFSSPGQPTETRTVQFQAPAVTENKIEFTFTERVQALVGLANGRFPHTTFRGDLSVAFAATGANRAVSGTLRNTTIDMHPPSARALAQEAGGLSQGQGVLRYLGLTVAPALPPAAEGASPAANAGLRIAAVEPDRPGSRLGILPGDVLVRFGGVRVVSVADLVPPRGQRLVPIGVERVAGLEPLVFTADLAGLSAWPPAEIVGTAILLAIAAAILLLFMAPVAGVITWVERRIFARMQSRIGPNRVGPQGFLQWLADGLKAILKEDIIPTDADAPLFRFAPYLVFIGVSATFVVMPFGQYLIAADLDVGILFVVAVTSLVTIGLMTGGWASNNKWSLLGGVRSAAQIISYEVPAALAIVVVVMMSGTLRMQGIVEAQGGAPWDWFLFQNPITFLLFFLYFTAALAEGNRGPFDLPEAESELVAGYSTEYSGMRYLFFFFAEWANVFVMSGIAAALFLGGWQVPGVTPAQQEASLGLQLLGALVFQLKSWFLIFVVIWVRWTLPRVRIDQLMNMCWKYFVPLSFAAFLAGCVWVVVPIPPWLSNAIRYAIFGIGCLGAAFMLYRIVWNLRVTKLGWQKVRLNPFI